MEIALRCRWPSADRINAGITYGRMAHKGERKFVSDDELVELVFQLRREHGGCTLAMLAGRTGLTKAGTQVRVNALIAEKRLVRAEDPMLRGSLRTADEVLAREDAQGRIVFG